MGQHLVKVRMGSREAQNLVLANSYKLRQSGFWYACFFRPSLTHAQRVERAENYKIVKAAYDERKKEEATVILRSKPDFIGFELVKSDSSISPNRIQPACPPRRRQHNHKY